MKRFLAVAAGCLVVAGCAEVRVPGIAAEDRVIIVTGQGEASAPADQFSITNFVTVTGAGAGRTREIAGDVMVGYMVQMKGNMANDDELHVVQTSQTPYLPDGSFQSPYSIDLAMSVTAPLDDRAVRLIAGASHASAGVGPVVFSVADSGPLRQAAAKDALTDAVAQAEAIAAEAGLRVGDIVSIEVHHDDSALTITMPEGQPSRATLPRTVEAHDLNLAPFTFSTVPMPAGQPTSRATVVVQFNLASD